MKQPGIIAICILFFTSLVLAQDNQPETKEITFNNAIDFCPEYPIVDVYALQYSRILTPKDELIFGVGYLNQKYDCGQSNAGGLIFGYRRYLWSRFHIEYQLWPIYDNFYEKNENKHYKSFDVWNEFRAGYGFDFTLGKCPLYINAQWPFGFGLYGSNKPQSFKDENSGKKKLFYFPPLVFIGVRF
ncbi:MAG TPA: hypothetical protein PLP19_10340 [bacterium]|nr:hypothetical protein [bacterium]HPN43877.1 hypothetical protein [bacterium]